MKKLKITRIIFAIYLTLAVLLCFAPTELRAKDTNSDKVIITNIESWKHSAKEVFQTYGFELEKVELMNKRTYPIFYVAHNVSCDINNEGLLREIAEKNGFWDFKIVDDQGYVEVLCDKERKQIQKINFDKTSRNIKCSELFCVFQNHKYGYIDKNGKMVVGLQYDWGGKFKEGLAPVRLNGKFGYIDSSGKLVISLKYLYAGEFSEGLANVQNSNGKYGFINVKGQYIIAPQFDDAGKFSENVAKAKCGNYYSYINKKGKIVIKTKFEYVSDFHEGLAGVAGGHFIDKSGKIVIKSKAPYDTELPISDFFDGFAIVKVAQKDDFKLAYVDSHGKILGGLMFDEASPFSEGFASVCLRGNWGYIDRNGKMVIKGGFCNGGKFSEGLASISINKKIGFIDKTGKIIIEPKYTNVWEGFYKNLALVELNGEYICIDKTGKVVWRP